MSDIEIPRYEIAERALDDIRRAIDQWTDSGKSHTSLLVDIAFILDIADTHLRMASLRRDRRKPKWLAKVTSFSFGRGFNAPGEFGNDPDPHLCFTVEITDGSKLARGKAVEVQASDDDMERLAQQILRMAALRRKMKGEGS